MGTGYPQATPGGGHADRDTDDGLGEAQDWLLPCVLRAHGRGDHHHRGGEGGRDHVAKAAEQANGQRAGSLGPPGPCFEGQEDQVDQAQDKAHRSGRETGHRGGHALFMGGAAGKDRGEHRPQATDESSALDRK